MPMSDAVSNAMRMLSVEPLTEGVPCHCATDGILSNSPCYHPSKMCETLASRAAPMTSSYVNVEGRIG